MNILGIVLGATIVFALLVVLGKTGGGAFEENEEHEEFEEE